MGYKKGEIYQKAKIIAKEKKCFFVEQLISFLPCSKPTFYDHIKIDSNEFNDIKEILEENKVEIKTAMYNKWFKSDNPTLQIGLMKLISTDEEAHRLNGTRIETNNKNINYNSSDLSKLSTETLLQVKKELESDADNS